MVNARSTGTPAVRRRCPTWPWLLAVMLVVGGCWMEPANAPQSRRDNVFSRVWEGDYEGYGILTWNLIGVVSEEDVVFRIHDRNHNEISFELFLVPTRDLSPRLEASGLVTDTTRCQILDTHADVKQIVDIYRANGKIYGGIQTLDYNDNVIWKLERMVVRPREDEI